MVVSSVVVVGDDGDDDDDGNDAGDGGDRCGRHSVEGMLLVLTETTMMVVLATAVAKQVWMVTEDNRLLVKATRVV